MSQPPKKLLNGYYIRRRIWEMFLAGVLFAILDVFLPVGFYDTFYIGNILVGIFLSLYSLFPLTSLIYERWNYGDHVLRRSLILGVIFLLHGFFFLYFGWDVLHGWFEWVIGVGFVTVVLLNIIIRPQSIND